MFGKTKKPFTVKHFAWFGGSATLLASVFAMVVVPIIPTASVTDDPRTGWAYETVHGQRDPVAVRCLPGTDVLVALPKDGIIAANSIACAEATLQSRLRMKNNAGSGVEADMKPLLAGAKTVSYWCAPPAGGIGSGVLWVTFGNRAVIVSSDVCGPM